MDLPDKILIVGLGMTGLAVARFLSRMGKQITITDEKREDELAPSLKALEGIRFAGYFGSHRRDTFLGHPLIVVSPGVDSELIYLKEARERGSEVIGEVELACRYIKEPIIAVTGTNGKTTVTTLIGEIFKRAYSNVFVGGNIGNPLINYLLEEKRAEYVIIEVSSFQLETIVSFKPDTAILLNVTEDHLDRYRSFEDYKSVKYRIFENQTEQEHAILNKDLTLEKDIRAQKLFFSSRHVLGEGAFSDNGILHVKLGGRDFVYKREASPLTGVHNTENLLAAMLVGHRYEIPQDVVEKVLGEFRGLPHRVEFVREIDGVKFYNDSKATNVDATKRALEGMSSRVILIAGGKDKGGSYNAITRLSDRINSLVLIGEAKGRIAAALGDSMETHSEDSLAAAVAKASSMAHKGDVVLFSPMCSSFDMFRDYKERGDMFKRLVESM